MSEKPERRKARGRGKGQAFEREVCRQLSLWWTEGVRDDVFWRSSNSGGRATVRSKKGKGTFGQYGDIQATDPVGQPLLGLLTIECKRGAGATLLDVLENGRRRDKNNKPSPWEMYLRQVLADKEKSGRRFWWLITRRNCFEAMIYLPSDLYLALQKAGSILHKTRPWLVIRPRSHRQELDNLEIFGTQLSSFLRKCKPSHIKKISDAKL